MMRSRMCSPAAAVEAVVVEVVVAAATVATVAGRWTAANRRVWTGNRSTRLIQRYEGRGGVCVGGRVEGKMEGRMEGRVEWLWLHILYTCVVRVVYIVL